MKHRGIQIREQLWKMLFPMCCNIVKHCALSRWSMLLRMPATLNVSNVSLACNNISQIGSQIHTFQCFIVAEK